MNRPCVKIAVMAVLMVCDVAQAVSVTDYAAALDMGYQYLDPRPQSEYVARETRLLIRFERTSPAGFGQSVELHPGGRRKERPSRRQDHHCHRRQDRRLRALDAVPGQ